MVCSCVDTSLLPDPVEDKGLIQIVPRVVTFREQVSTKAEDLGKSDEETNLTCMAVAIFDSDGKCIDLQFSDGVLSFTLDRTELAEKVDKSKLNEASIYAFANIPSYKELAKTEDWKEKTLDYFTAIDVPVSGVTIPSDGLPMMGVYYGQENSDGTLLPKVNLNPDTPIASPLINIDLHSAYAKIYVSVSVNATDYETLGIKSYFTPTNWQVFNVPTTVDFDADSNSDTEVIEAVAASGKFEGIQAIDNDKVSFYFYLPERYLTGANTFNYPFATDENNTVRKEDEGLRQKYKKDHLSINQKATYVKLSGVFSDYQGHKKRVEYDLYVGENNYDDFNVRRNVLYSNNVVIRASKQSNDVEWDLVAYDGRVTFDESRFTVKLERETVLDAHWEIRPMRVSVLEGSVTVSIENAASTPWIRMENSTAVESADDKTKYLDVEKSTDLRYGKRKYFTTNLLTELSGNVEDELGPGEHCIWVYVDENTSETKNGVRTAVISFNDGINEPLEYTIAQAYLLPIETKRKENNNSTYTYSIETHEEYLYNYDAMNGYGQTEYNGMPWGLDGVKLSHIYPALKVEYQTGTWDWIFQLLGTDFDGLVNSALMSSDKSPYYDFYLSRDNAPGGAEIRDFNGKQFNVEIAENLIDNYTDHQGESSTQKAKINGVKLDEDPLSAFAYCYNKNKRNEKGEVVYKNSNGTWNTDNLKWYLPAIDEIEDIAEYGYGVDEVFHENLYWSCQPAYARSTISIELWSRFSSGSYDLNQTISGTYFEDYTSRARATRAKFTNGQFEEPVSSAIPDDAVYGTQSGTIKFTTHIFTDTTIDENTLDEYVPSSQVVDYSAYPGNKLRTDVARVRCVYKP